MRVEWYGQSAFELSTRVERLSEPAFETDQLAADGPLVVVPAAP